MADLTIANESFSMADAERIIAAYCFDEDETAPTPPSPAYGPPPQPWQRPLMAYRSYDCQRGESDAIDIVDIVSPVLLNVVHGFGVAMVSNLLAVAPLVDETVRGVSSRLKFWTIPIEDIADPVEGSPAWLLHRAWYLVESVPGCGLTITHKILHHAWPHLFPLIDTTTAPRLGDSMWLTIREELESNEAQFEALERWFAAVAAERDGVSLTRLRLYDILLWTRVREQERTVT